MRKERTRLAFPSPGTQSHEDYCEFNNQDGDWSELDYFIILD